MKHFYYDVVTGFIWKYFLRAVFIIKPTPDCQGSSSFSQLHKNMYPPSNSLNWKVPGKWVLTRATISMFYLSNA